MRQELGLSQEETASILALSGKKAVSNIETGLRNPGHLVFVLMCALVKLPVQKSAELQNLLRGIAAKEFDTEARKE